MVYYWLIFLLLYNGMNHFDTGKYISLQIIWASHTYKTPPNLKWFIVLMVRTIRIKINLVRNSSCLFQCCYILGQTNDDLSGGKVLLI